MTETPMVEAKSPEYVGAWLGNIARNTGLADHEIAPILERVTGQTGAMAANPVGLQLVDHARAAEIAGTMTPTVAKTVVAEARAYAARKYPHGRCHYCGCAITSTGCTECA